MVWRPRTRTGARRLGSSRFLQYIIKFWTRWDPDSVGLKLILEMYRRNESFVVTMWLLPLSWPL
jgi:hypothetical protein